MLLHDNYIPFIVNLQAVVVFHSEVKCTNCIFCFKCISIMADNDKTLIGDGNLSNNKRKSSAPSTVPSSAGTMHSDTHPTHHAAVSEPTTLKRKQTSFQITSVTVKGSRLSTDGGEDSADDLDESHTEDANSDILDCSRTTDVDNDQLSECSNVNNDESSVHAPSIPVKCTELPVNQDAQTNEKMSPSESSKDDKLTVPSETNQSQHVVNPPALPDQWQHRFRVVKIVSSEPFKRGRWLCMDFMDPPAPAVEAKPEVSDSTPSSGTQMIPSSSFPDTVPTDRVAHIYEISPSDAYPGSISVAVGPDHIQQPMYGIFLPVNNGQYPFITGINTTARLTIQEEVKRPEPQSATALTIQQSQILSTGQTTFTEAQPPFPCQQTQAVTTPASQNPVQPPTIVQVCSQHQSQNSVQPLTTVEVCSQHQSQNPVQPPTSVQICPQPQSLNSVQPSTSVQVCPQPQSQNPVQPPTSVQVCPQPQSQNPVQPPISVQVGLQPHSQNPVQPPTSVQVCPQPQSQNLVQPPTSVQVCPQPQSQNPVQPPTTVQVCLQHQSQINVVAPTPATTMQQSAVSAPVIPIPSVTPASSIQSATPPPQSQVIQESQLTMQQRVQSPVVPQSHSVPVSTTQAPSVAPPNATVISSTPQVSDLQNIVNPPVLPVASVVMAQTSSVGTQATAAASNIPEVTLALSITNTEPAAVPSQVVQNHVEVKELGTPPSTNPQQIPETSTEVPPAKSDINGEDPESVPSGTSTVAIDNKIEQAMDLVKSHLMFAVREEVDVLKEKITELMDRISQLEYENGFLRANASQQTLEQLNQTQLLQQQQQQQNQQNQPSTVSMNSIQVNQQPTSQQQINIQNPQSTS